jgi:hypothetical protein
MVADLNDLASSDNPQVVRIVRLLRSAITLSLQSDYSYQGWMTANASTDVTIPCARTHEANWTASQEIAPRAGAAKKAFLAAYLPVAARLSLRSDWTFIDI